MLLTAIYLFGGGENCDQTKTDQIKSHYRESDWWVTCF